MAQNLTNTLPKELCFPSHGKMQGISRLRADPQTKTFPWINPDIKTIRIWPGITYPPGLTSRHSLCQHTCWKDPDRLVNFPPSWPVNSNVNAKEVGHWNVSMDQKWRQLLCLVAPSIKPLDEPGWAVDESIQPIPRPGLRYLRST